MKNQTHLTSLVFNGKALPGFWSTSYVDLNYLAGNSSSGAFALVLSIKGDKEFDAERAGGLLVEHLEEKYYEIISSQDVITAMEKAIAAGIDQLASLLEREKNSAKGGIDLDIAILSILEDKYIYFANFGNGFVLLSREGKFINIGDSLKTRANPHVRVGSGEINTNDVFVIATPNSTLTIPEEEVTHSIEKFTFDNLGDADKYPGCSIVFIKKEFKQENIQPVITDEILEIEKEVKVIEDNSIEESTFGPIEETKVVQSEEGMGEKLKALYANAKTKVASLASEDKKQTYSKISASVKLYLGKLISFLHKTVWLNWLGFGKDKVFLRGAGPRFNWKGIAFVGVALLIVVYLLFSSINGISKRKEENKKKDEVNALLKEVDSLINDVQTARSQSNSVKAREDVSKIENLISQAESKGVLADEINNKKSQIQSIKNQVNKIIVLGQDSVLTDLSAFFENVHPTDMQLIGSDLYISDSDASAIYKVSLDGRSAEQIFSGANGLGKPVSLTTDESGQLIIMDKSNGIMVADLTDNSVKQIAGLSTLTVGDAKALATFKDPGGNNYLYYLVPAKKAINRSTSNAGNFSFPSIRYENDLFGQSQDLEIDAAYNKVYALIKEQQGIIRYAGEVDRYEIFGLPLDSDGKPIKLSDSSCLEVSLNYLFFGDPVGKRVVAVTKFTSSNNNAGNFIGQFMLEGSLSNIVEISVDKEGKNIFVLDGTKVIRADLSSLEQ